MFYLRDNIYSLSKVKEKLSIIKGYPPSSETSKTSIIELISFVSIRFYQQCKKQNLSQGPVGRLTRILYVSYGLARHLTSIFTFTRFNGFHFQVRDLFIFPNNSLIRCYFYFNKSIYSHKVCQQQSSDKMYHLAQLLWLRQIPHVLPELNRMYPFSPQLPPHEFLIFQFPPTIPTNNTAWLIDVAQLLNTPEEQRDQFVASTATEIGCKLIDEVRALQDADTQPTELILKVPPFFWQVCYFALYGQVASAVIPFATMYFSAEAGHPPLHPLFPQLVEQSISCCSERSQVVLVLISAHDSQVPIAANAQHDPHCPWFLTLVTPPFVVQSISALGTSDIQSQITISCYWLGRIIYERNLALNYSSEKIVN